MGTASDEASDEDEVIDLFDGNVELDEGGKTFEDVWQSEIDLIVEFVGGLRYQSQFRDQRMPKTLQREGAGFFRLARACLDKEKRLRSQRGGDVPSTWEKSITALFYWTITEKMSYLQPFS